MIYEEYLKLKDNDQESVYILKKGCFYVAYDIDAIITSYLFNYKIRKYEKYKMVDFPINIIDKIIMNLKSLSINYMVYNLNDDKIEYIDNFQENTYYLALSNAVNNDKDTIIDIITAKLNSYNVERLNRIKNIIDGIN